MNGIRFQSIASCAAFAVLALLLIVSPALAVLSVTNGDFNAGLTGTDETDIEDPWFDVTTGNFWDTAWHSNRNSPFDGSPLVGLSGSVSPSWFYQNIGTRGAADTSLGVSIDLGSFTSVTELRGGDLTISVYQSGTFVGANDADVTGETLVDSVTLASGSLAAGDTVNLSDTLDLTTANTTDYLFLNFAWTGMRATALWPPTTWRSRARARGQTSDSPSTATPDRSR